MPELQNHLFKTELAMPNLNAVSAEILASGCREVEMLMATQGPMDGAGEIVWVRGDVSPKCKVFHTRALVIEGDVSGTAQAPCQLESEGPVVVMGAVRFATIRGQAIYLGKGARECFLFAEDEVNVLGDMIEAEVHIGNGEKRHCEIETLKNNIAKNKDTREKILWQIKYEKNRLNSLLQATGIVFNLNIGQIIKYAPDGIGVNLSSFYKALENRDEEEIDQALKEFFAKAILGLLTRLNQHYISEGPGHRKRFAAVVTKLRDLVFLTRNFDKLIFNAQIWETQISENLEAARSGGGVRIGGAIFPRFHCCFIHCHFDKKENDVYEVRKMALTLRPGKVKGKNEVVFWRDDQVLDLQFITPDLFSKMIISSAKDRVVWKALNQA